MKMNKMISLDLEIVEKLKKEGNASSLVNSLIVEHYRKQDPLKMTKEEREARIAELKIHLEAQEKLQELKNG